jgi:hypothetical protein
MRHVLHLMQPARPGGRGGDEGRPTGPCAFPRDRWVSRSATSTVTIRNDGFTSKPAKLKSWFYATNPMDQSQAAALHRATLQA